MIFAYDKDRIYFAFDKYDIDDDPAFFPYYYKNPTEENLPCWHPHEGMLIYVSSPNARITDLIRYYVKIPTEISFVYAEDLYRAITDLLKRNGYETFESKDYWVVIANSVEGYRISGGGVIDRLEHDGMLGGGNRIISDSVSKEEIPPLEAIKEYFRKEHSYIDRKNDSIIVMNTAESGVQIVELD